MQNVEGQVEETPTEARQATTVRWQTRVFFISTFAAAAALLIYFFLYAAPPV